MTRFAATSLALLLLVPGLTHASADEPGSNDPLAAEIERWSAFLRDTTSSDENWKDLKPGMEPAMARAEAALKDGRRLLALERLSAVRMNLAGFAYVNALPFDKRGDAASLDSEWTRVGALLGAEAAVPSPSALDGVQPAAVRAEGEAALPQVRNYYDTSLDYGRATMPWSGLFYLGVAQAQRDFVTFCRTISARTDLKAPKVRSLAVELDALEADLLRAYRPPASIDRHSEFIGASAALKEARELDAAGLRYGALLRYLQASMRIDPLRPDPPQPDPAGLPKRLEAFESRLRQGGVDHSIGRLYLETAQANPAFAEAIARDVLPRYFAALAPVTPRPHKPAPSITVTLVRWPYT
jgi:hypothetical protein